MITNEVWVFLLFFSLCLSFGINSGNMKKIKKSIEYIDDNNIKEILKFNHEMNMLLFKFLFSAIGIIFIMAVLILQQFT